MRFLVDRCAGARLADWLRTQGYDVLEARTRGPDPGDRAILAWAVEEDRIVATIDTDFGTWIYREGDQHCGMVRLPDVPAAQRIQLMEQVLSKHADDLEAGAVVTVRGGRIRVSRPPAPPS